MTDLVGEKFERLIVTELIGLDMVGLQKRH